MAWAKYAAGCGLTLEQIKTELLNGRDLGKQRNRRRHIEYASAQPARRLSSSMPSTAMQVPGQQKPALKGRGHSVGYGLNP